MKTYTTSQAQDFTIDYASSLPAGYGHRKISVYVCDENGNKKEFAATTNDMMGFDEANNLEDQEKWDALYELVENSLDGLIAEWISDNDNE